MEPTAHEIEQFETRLNAGKLRLAQKAAQDVDFHDALTKNPKETFEKFFQLPEGTLKEIGVQVFEEKPRSIGIVIPPRPGAPGDELSEEQLEGVSGAGQVSVQGTLVSYSISFG